MTQEVPKKREAVETQASGIEASRSGLMARHPLSHPAFSFGSLPDLTVTNLKGVIRRGPLLLLLSALGCSDLDATELRNQVEQVGASYHLKGTNEAVPKVEESPEQRKERILDEMIREAMCSPEWEKIRKGYLSQFPYHLLKTTLNLYENKSNEISPAVVQQTLQTLIEELSYVDIANLKTKFPDAPQNCDVVLEEFFRSMKLWHEEPYAEATIIRFTKNFPLKTLEKFKEVNLYFNNLTMVHLASLIAQKCPVEAVAMQNNYSSELDPKMAQKIYKAAIQAAVGAKPCSKEAAILNNK